MKKQATQGAGVMSGLSEQEKINSSPKSHGMDTTGADQKPMATPKEKVGGSFTIR